MPKPVHFSFIENQAQLNKSLCVQLSWKVFGPFVGTRLQRDAAPPVLPLVKVAALT